MIGFVVQSHKCESQDLWRPFNYGTNCHVRETNLSWFELCDMVCYPPGRSFHKLGTLLKDAQLV